MSSIGNHRNPLNQKQLHETGTVKYFAEGDVVFQKQSTGQSIPFVTKGSVKVVQTDDDYKEMLLYYLQPGDTCVVSLLGSFYNSPAGVKAIAEEEAEVVFIPQKEFRKLMNNDPTWLDYIFRIYHQRFMELLDVVNSVAFKKMDERILELLQKKSHLSGSRILSLTHEQIAQELGSSREVISRLLKQIEIKGLVELERNRIILL